MTVSQSVSQCRWCTGKACSPGHRFSFPVTKLWPSGSEAPPTTSPAAAAGGGAAEDRREEDTSKEGQRQKGGNQRYRTEGTQCARTTRGEINWNKEGRIMGNNVVEEKTGSGEIFRISPAKLKEDTHEARWAVVPNISTLLLSLFHVSAAVSGPMVLIMSPLCSFNEGKHSTFHTMAAEH